MKKWLILFGAILFLFRGAFSTYLFQDDFFGFGISKISSFNQFLNFFSIFRGDRFYRPLSTEVFYFISQNLNNLFLTRLLVFSVFFTGLLFLYKIIVLLAKNKSLAFLTVFIYAVSFTHIFQLYWLATFQEVAMFSFSCAATYFFLKRNWLGLVFFLAALLSKESAIVLPLVLLLLTRDFRRTFPYFLLVLPLLIVYKINYAGVALKPEYVPIFNPKLIGNNLLWYVLWAFGLPNFFPDFIPSIFSLPTQSLWTAINNARALPYLIFWGLFIGFLGLTLIISRNKKIILMGVFCLLGFLIYVLPISVIVHKWMVRLTIPVIFSSLFLAYLMVNSKRWLAIPLVVFYVLYNFLAIPVHENTSTYKYESKIVQNVALNILDKDFESVCFSDEIKPENGWEGSRKLKLTLFDQWFLSYYFPNQKKRAFYGFDDGVYPSDCLIIPARAILTSASDR